MKIIIVVTALFLGGCQLGQTVMVSKGRAGAMQAVFRGDGEFCKLTSTEGVQITEADRESFRTYCLSK